MQPLPPFDENGVCPKCGGKLIASLYAAEREFPDVCDKETREHIHRTCERCFYEWNEATVEHKQ